MARRSPEARARRKAKLKARIASAVDLSDNTARCLIPDPVAGKPCGRLTARAARKGLATMCRRHQAHMQRHGSPWCKSPTATALRPYLKAALSYVNLLSKHDPYIKAALDGIGHLLAFSPAPEPVPRLRGRPPLERARQALARMCERDVKPSRLLAIVFAVHALLKEASGTYPLTTEWRIVAIAKAAHRLASGTHKRYEMTDNAGNVIQRSEWHAYPRSAGRVLRHLGEMLEREAELAVEHHLAPVLALKLKRYGPYQRPAQVAA